MSILRPFLRSLGMAGALGAPSACEKSVEQPRTTTTPLPQEQIVASARERFHVAIGAESVIEKMASDPGAWKFFPPHLAEAAWKDMHAEAMAAAGELSAEDQAACLKRIREGGE